MTYGGLAQLRLYLAFLFRCSVLLVRFRSNLFQGFPGTCLNIRIPRNNISYRQESMGLPKFPEYLFLHAMACGLRRIYPSSPIFGWNRVAFGAR